MHGPGTPPPHGHQPSTGGVVALRVLFALLPILSCGFLAWGTMLRLALVTRQRRDWWLLAASAVLAVVWPALSGADPTPDNTGWQANTGAIGAVLTGLSITVYYLVTDIRYHQARQAVPALGWYPPAASPYTPTQRPPSYGYPPVPHQTPAPTPRQVPEPAPAPTPPPRIGQVRAELDELSELLRKQQPPHNEGPRP
ncbi:hypothetical protein [Streptomyces sp. H34-S4]|uniref:hypothetical protein n=1 Tax=Streptomyces sp. H34-S4 TaxID=2996463 RepID=UPI00226DA0DE|nr:hypothetical protein [Streptomyces sp. H34-S4]MCY0934725.1 hypothetical protein [Streptomyces sp. H34-S4]